MTRAFQARKRFGQNFLKDQAVIARIIAAIAPKPGQRLVEIGPGLGALTEPLLEATGGALDVIELDRDLVPILRTKFFNYPELKIHAGDALTFDFASLVKPGEKLRIVGNLPYNISTPLIFHLLGARAHIHDMHFMLQQEVVDRLSAPPDCGAYGRLGIMVQYFCAVEALLEVPPHAFQPQPKVQSAIVRLEPYAQLPVPVRDFSLLERVVKAAFAQRRKTIANNLKPLMSADQLQALGIDPRWRAENLTLQNFADISDTLCQGSETS